MKHTSPHKAPVTISLKLRVIAGAGVKGGVDRKSKAQDQKYLSLIPGSAID